jgi:hypothetical protein
LTLALEPHIEHITAPAENLASLVQSAEQRPVLWVFRDLLDPTEQRNGGSLRIAPPVPGRSGCISGHGAPAFLGLAVVTGRPPRAQRRGPLAQPAAGR